MHSIAAIIDWERADITPSALMRMFAAVRSRAPDGVRMAIVEHAGLGAGVLASTVRERTALQPVCDLRTGICVVSDARIDNRDELSETLLGSRMVVPSDPELLALGYARWGTGLTERIEGDFSFVIWDRAHRTGFAAVDHFGSRQLYFTRDNCRPAIASDPQQLLCVEGVGRDIDDERALDFLTDRLLLRGRTMLRDVAQLEPGHFAVFETRRVRTRRYWNPPVGPSRPRRRDDYVDEARALFRRAVEVRLESDRPIVAHLSGGLDSSSIVCMADDLAADPARRVPRIHIASAVYPGLEADETDLIRSVARRVRFPAELRDDASAPVSEWPAANATLPSGLEFARGMPPDIDVARAIGARVVLSGLGGDQVWSDHPALLDLAVAGRWWALLTELYLAPNLSGLPSTRLARYVVRSLASPDTIDAYRRLRGRASETPPAWLGERLRPLWTAPAAPVGPRIPPIGWSHVQQATWDGVGEARLHWCLELLQHRAAHHGFEMRFPWLDVRLVRLVLSMPPDVRRPHGQARRMHRDVIRPLVPRAIAQRRGVTYFNSQRVRDGLRAADRLWALFSERRWETAPWVVQRAMREALSQIRNSGATVYSDWEYLSRVAALEAWRRSVLDLPPTMTRFRMSTDTSRPISEERSIAEAEIAGKGKEYEAPKIAYLGNLREVLAGGGVTQSDAPLGGHKV